MKNKLLQKTKFYLGSLSIGLVNSMFGAGGGIFAVWLLKELIPDDNKRAHASAVAVVLCVSVVSAINYLNRGYVSLNDILFFIPGTPKDILTYLCPFTKIKPLHYFILSTFARIPSIVSSTLVGDTLADGSMWTAAIIFVATGVLGLIGITLNKIIINKHNRQNRI